MPIPDDQIEQVRSVANIVEVVSAHVPLTRKGQNHWGLCPFHSEKSASFTVHEQKQIFHCFGCGEGGNVFSFVMKMEGASFPEAVNQLAERYGIPLTVTDGKLSAQKKSERERVSRVNDMAQTFFARQMQRAQADGVQTPNEVATYLQRRGLDEEAVQAFELGWAPDEWQALSGHLQEQGVSRDDLLLSGVAVKGQRAGGLYDRFRGRLMFPIRDAAGVVVGFGGRVLGTGEPKYLNSPETPLYHKGRVLYGLHRARAGGKRPERICVVEGYMDVIACHRHGIDWAVAPLGTALTEDHARLLTRFTDRVDLVFDGDAAGKSAAYKAINVLAGTGLEVWVVSLPKGEDPDSVAQREGSEQLARRLNAGKPMLDFLLDAAVDGTAGMPVERRLKAAEPLMSVLERITDPLRKGHYLARLAEALGIHEGEFRRAFARRQGARRNRTASAPSAPEPVQPLPYGEDMLLHLLCQGQVEAKWLFERVSPGSFTAPAARQVAELLEHKTQGGARAETILDGLQDAPEAMALVTRWLNTDVTVEGEPMECAQACISDLMRREQREVSHRLLHEIRKAEADGDTGRLMALLRQKEALAKAHSAVG